MNLPLFQVLSDQSFSLLQTKWKSILDPLLGIPTVNGNLLSNIVLVNGDTVINHKLGRKLIGWQITDQNAAASIYRSKPISDTTLTLTSNAICTISLWVF